MDRQAVETLSMLLRPDGTPVRVLVVDDEPDAAYVVSTVLRYQGWRVRSAADGVDAVTKATEFRPDAVALDVLLPGIDGPEVARRIRAVLPEVRVLFLTACDAVDAGIPAGDACLTKPVGLEEIVARVRGMLRRVGAVTPRIGSASAADAGRPVVGDLVPAEEAGEGGRRASRRFPGIRVP
ncbi:response regulator [Streptomyces regalis]|uniref:Response regulatory domain-containing protein n=1 Tax=Streptomyces regalis TaxID=68262 RepID=A0A101J8K1_9ACTN|nr:hypothetical protein ADL12_42740 [Streptomyces regalis]